MINYTKIVSSCNNSLVLSVDDGCCCSAVCVNIFRAVDSIQRVIHMSWSIAILIN